MSMWICRPSLAEKDIGFTIANVLDGDTIVTIDTENVQDSIRDAFCDSGWEAGESFGFGTGDVFRADEYDNYFDIYANDKMIARFCKDRLFR